MKKPFVIALMLTAFCCGMQAQEVPSQEEQESVAESSVRKLGRRIKDAARETAEDARDAIHGLDYQHDTTYHRGRDDRWDEYKREARDRETQRRYERERKNRNREELRQYERDRSKRDFDYYFDKYSRRYPGSYREEYEYNRRDGRYDGRYEGRYDERYDGRYDERHEGRYDGRYDERYDDGRYEGDRRNGRRGAGRDTLFKLGGKRDKRDGRNGGGRDTLLKLDGKGWPTIGKPNRSGSSDDNSGSVKEDDNQNKAPKPQLTDL